MLGRRSLVCACAGNAAGHCCRKSSADLGGPIRTNAHTRDGNFYQLKTRGPAHAPPPPPSPPGPATSGRAALCVSGQLRTLDRTYRGINGLPHLERYTDGSKIHWSGFSSTSSDAAAAAQFAAGGGIVFVLKVHNAKDIRPFSWFDAAEGEPLLSPNMEFLVTKELHDPTDEPLRSLCAAEGCQAIEMRQIPSGALWS